MSNQYLQHTLRSELCYIASPFSSCVIYFTFVFQTMNTAVHWCIISNYKWIIMSFNRCNRLWHDVHVDLFKRQLCMFSRSLSNLLMSISYNTRRAFLIWIKICFAEFLESRFPLHEVSSHGSSASDNYQAVDAIMHILAHFRMVFQTLLQFQQRKDLPNRGMVVWMLDLSLHSLLEKNPAIRGSLSRITLIACI